MASEQDAARARVLAARADFDREYQALTASTREAVDIPAKIRRNPARAAAVAGGLGFVVVGGPWRVVRGARRLAFGSPKALPKSMLPEEIEKTLKKMGSDGDKVRGTLERDFADYARKAQRDRRQVMLAVLLPFVRPIAARGAKAMNDYVFGAGEQTVGEIVTDAIDSAKANVDRGAADAKERVDRAARSSTPPAPGTDRPTGV